MDSQDIIGMGPKDWKRRRQSLEDQERQLAQKMRESKGEEMEPIAKELWKIKDQLIELDGLEIYSEIQQMRKIKINIGDAETISKYLRKFSDLLDREGHVKLGFMEAEMDLLDSLADQIDRLIKIPE